jgi:hypothetical protein
VFGVQKGLEGTNVHEFFPLNSVFGSCRVLQSPKHGELSCNLSYGSDESTTTGQPKPFSWDALGLWLQHQRIIGGYIGEL